MLLRRSAVTRETPLLLLRDALGLLNAGRFDEAEASCARAMRAAPADPAVLQLHATIALRRGDPASARRSVALSLAQRPDHAPTLLLAAHVEFAAGDRHAAIALSRRAVGAAPDAAPPAFMLCHLLLDNDDPTLPAALAAAARHTDETSWHRLAMALHRAGRPSLDAWSRAAASADASAGSLFGLGMALRGAGRLTEAEPALARVTARDPAHSHAWFALGLTRQDLLDEPGAEIAYRAALQHEPTLAEAAVNLGIALQRQGRLQPALDAYRTAIRLRPDSFGRIAQALSASATGMLVLDLEDLRRRLGG